MKCKHISQVKPKILATYVINKAAIALKKGMATLKQILNKIVVVIESADILNKGDSSSKKYNMLALN